MGAELRRILEGADANAKIACIGGLGGSDEAQTVRLVMERLDDADIRVRGEAFGYLVSDGMDISGQLMGALDSDSKNIRGYAAIILANRGDSRAILGIAALTVDPESMVRSCALGALGFLGASSEGVRILECLCDPVLEVRKSALQACIDLGIQVPKERLTELTGADAESDWLVAQAGKTTP